MKIFCIFVKIILITLATANISVGAVTLSPVPPPSNISLTVGRDTSLVPCDQIADRLQNYNHQARQQDQSVSAFLGQVTDKLNAWYAVLSPLEGSVQTIAGGTFAPIKDGADQVTQITNMAFDNSDLLATEMDTLITSLRACQISHK